jgi:ribosomal-protein-alanine N-acetyltransferase
VSAWRVRPATPRDKDAIIAVEAEAFASASWGARAVADGMKERGVDILVATRGDSLEPSGFIFWRRAGDEAEILSIGVARAARRQGCARALLSEIVEKARGGGVRSLFLEVDVANAAAAILYQSAGFEKVGRRKRYYKNGGDALVMRLTL